MKKLQFKRYLKRRRGIFNKDLRRHGIRKEELRQALMSGMIGLYSNAVIHEDGPNGGYIKDA